MPISKKTNKTKRTKRKKGRPCVALDKVRL